jgi:RNA polymerase sigma-32 factor
VKIGTTQAQRKLFFNLRKEREKLEQLGFQPSTTALLAEKLDVSEKEVDRDGAPARGARGLARCPARWWRRRRHAQPDGLPAPMTPRSAGSARSRRGEFAQLLRGTSRPSPKTLEGREQTIFRERWLTDVAAHACRRSASAISVSRERARQLEKRMLDRLKQVPRVRAR